MSISLNTRKMVKDFGGLTACHRLLNDKGYCISRDAVDKWRRRHSLSTQNLLVLALVAKETGRRFDIYDYIEVSE